MILIPSYTIPFIPEWRIVCCVVIWWLYYVIAVPEILRYGYFMTRLRCLWQIVAYLQLFTVNIKPFVTSSVYGHRTNNNNNNNKNICIGSSRSSVGLHRRIHKLSYVAGVATLKEQWSKGETIGPVVVAKGHGWCEAGILKCK